MDWFCLIESINAMLSGNVDFFLQKLYSLGANQRSMIMDKTSLKNEYFQRLTFKTGKNILLECKSFSIYFIMTQCLSIYFIIRTPSMDILSEISEIYKKIYR